MVFNNITMKFSQAVETIKTHNFVSQNYTILMFIHHKILKCIDFYIIHISVSTTTSVAYCRTFFFLIAFDYPNLNTKFMQTSIIIILYHWVMDSSSGTSSVTLLYQAFSIRSSCTATFLSIWIPATSLPWTCCRFKNKAKKLGTLYHIWHLPEHDNRFNSRMCLSSHKKGT